jgi:NitT/TauT family transport system permease protein
VTPRIIPVSALHQRRASLFDVAGVLALALLVLVLFLDQRHVLPRGRTELDLTPALLPVYALYSLLRMAAAYALSLAFAFVAGYYASSSPVARRFLLPALDVLQSVPILGFFPAAIFFFIRLFHGSPLGMEAAAVFLIFTSQAWNLAFSVYESLSTIPDDLRTAVRVSGATGTVLWRRLLLPACLPSLVYNSMLSWAAGWYFLIASEVITVGRKTYTLPGLGSYIGLSIEQGRHANAAAGLLVLVGVIAALHVLVWAPLEHWSPRYRYEYASGGESASPPLASRFLERAPLFRRAWVRLARAVGQVFGKAAALASVLTHGVARRLLGALLVVCLALLAYGGIGVLRLVWRPLPGAAYAIPAALVFSFLRLLAAYLISLAWTLPLAFWISREARRAARVLPILQIAAGVPATAFFPLMVVAVLKLHLGLNVMAIALVLTGMQWYLLFNLVAGAHAMPADLRELAQATDVQGWLYFRRFFLPVAMPSLVTGSITAWGGGWNALVISEAVTAGGRTYSVTGIGALLDEATYVEGDLQMITLTIVAMVAVISVLNRLFWRPIFTRVSTRYRLEY